MTVAEKITLLKQKREEAKKMGGVERLAKQKAKGKLNARERLDILFDEGTFKEIDTFVKHRSTNFGMENIEVIYDCVIVWY